MTETLTDDLVHRAACRQHPNPELWWSDTIAQIEEARQICQGCPIREECTDVALDRNEEHGVWGGYDFSTMAGAAAAAEWRGRPAPEPSPRRSGKIRRLCPDCGSEFEVKDHDKLQCYPCVMGWVPAGPVQEHIARLRSDLGLSYSQLGKPLGMRGDALCTIVTQRTYLQKATADRILALDGSMFEGEDPREGVPALGAQRRLQSLVAAGHPMAYLARKLGMTPSNFGTLFHCRDFIPTHRHKQIVELFDQLRLVRGDSDRARTEGRRRDWPLPSQWKGINIDDPDAVPRPRVRSRVAS